MAGQARIDGASEWRGGSRCGETWRGLESIWMVTSTALSEGFEVDEEEEKNLE